MTHSQVGGCIFLKSETGHWPISLKQMKKKNKKNYGLQVLLDFGVLDTRHNTVTNTKNIHFGKATRKFVSFFCFENQVCYKGAQNTYGMAYYRKVVNTKKKKSSQTDKPAELLDFFYFTSQAEGCPKYTYSQNAMFQKRVNTKKKKIPEKNCGTLLIFLKI